VNESPAELAGTTHRSVGSTQPLEIHFGVVEFVSPAAAFGKIIDCISVICGACQDMTDGMQHDRSLLGQVAQKLQKTVMREMFWRCL